MIWIWSTSSLTFRKSSLSSTSGSLERRAGKPGGGDQDERLLTRILDIHLLPGWSSGVPSTGQILIPIVTFPSFPFVSLRIINTATYGISPLPFRVRCPSDLACLPYGHCKTGTFHPTDLCPRPIQNRIGEVLFFTFGLTRGTYLSHLLISYFIFFGFFLFFPLRLGRFCVRPSV